MTNERYDPLFQETKPLLSVAFILEGPKKDLWLWIFPNFDLWLLVVMLSAEQYALENKAVQSMMNIRNRELTFIDLRLGVIGFQAALCGGFMVSDLKLLPGEKHDSK